MSLETLIAENTAALERNTVAMEKLVAGREAALSQLEKVADGATPAKATRTRRTKADDAPAVSPVATGAGEEGPPAQDVGKLDDELRGAVAAYVNETGLVDADKASRIANIQSVMQHFGGALAGEKSTLDYNQKLQALFYVRRYTAGSPVDFSADYDFDGDPAQGAAPADEFDIG